MFEIYAPVNEIYNVWSGDPWCVIVYGLGRKPTRSALNPTLKSISIELPSKLFVTVASYG